MTFPKTGKMKTKYVLKLIKIRYIENQKEQILYALSITVITAHAIWF